MGLTTAGPRREVLPVVTSIGVWFKLNNNNNAKMMIFQLALRSMIIKVLLHGLLNENFRGRTRWVIRKSRHYIESLKAGYSSLDHLSIISSLVAQQAIISLYLKLRHVA